MSRFRRIDALDELQPHGESTIVKRRTLPAATALAATATLLLTACGSGDDTSSNNDKSVGADAESPTAASPTAAASTATDRPKIESVKDLSYTFDWPSTGNAAKDAVLSDSEQSIKAVDLAIVHQDALDKPYLYYYEGEAAAGTQKFIQNYVDHKAGITGTYHFYDPQVAVAKDGTASLSYCEDQGKAYVKYLATNKIEKTKVTAKSYVGYHTSLRRNGKGVWAIEKIISRSGSAECQP
ncbi:hypothetical protein [Streptomyces sp. NPDC048419]|uniref:hypothetical protein n=1 Tax=Streptomyces sp. NPDC048419 TaxID=3365547 RepID=UPI003722D906